MVVVLDKQIRVDTICFSSTTSSSCQFKLKDKTIKSSRNQITDFVH